MSIFASMSKVTIPMQGDEVQTITIRKLTGEEYEAAQVEHRAGFITGDKWAGFFREVGKNGPTSAALRKALADPLTGFSRYAVVRSGLVAWSYPQPVTPVAIDGAPEDAILDLDDDAVDFIAREILKLTKPLLFAANVAEAEGDQKKG